MLTRAKHRAEQKHRAQAGSSAVLEDAFDPHRNSLSLLRLLFAAMVLLDHAFPLGGFHGGSDPMWGWTRGQESFGGLAVAGFFVVSGFLVTRSFDGSPNPFSYLWKRFLRIFPGFWVCLVVTVALFGTIAFWFDHGSLHGYLHGYPDSPEGYLKNNALLSMNQWNIDNLLGEHAVRARGVSAGIRRVVVDVDLRVQVLSRRDGAGYVWRLPPLARECHRALPEPLGPPAQAEPRPRLPEGVVLARRPQHGAARVHL